MAKTSIAKDKLLASTGFIRAKYVAKLLMIHPKTVLRTDYEKFKYGAVFYLNWTDVLAKISPHLKFRFKLPEQASDALDMVFGVQGIIENIKVVSDPSIPKDTFVLVKANDALSKAKSLLATKPNAPPSPEPTQLPVELTNLKPGLESILTLPKKVVEVDPVDDSEKCTKCGHAIEPYHMGTGVCAFGIGTVAQCTWCIS